MMNNFQIIFLISAAFFHHFSAVNSNLDAKRKDKIKHLPGLEFSPNFEHYSGYLRVSGEHELFYWLTTSQNNSLTDPLIFWFNGGPGCSSLFGLLGELGPYLVDREGQKLVRNPNAWNRHASVVYIESPSFVGYSIPGNSPNATDVTTAKENYAAIKEFMAKFPEYRHHQLFITGESYAGIYLPTLAEQIIDGQKEFEINFRGMAIGNGYVNVSMNRDTRNRYYYGHGMVDEMEWEFVKREKCHGNIDDCDLSKMYFGIHRHHYHYNPYDIYEICVGGNGQLEGHQLQSFVSSQQQSNFEMPLSFVNLPAPDKELICENEHDTETYLNRKDVRKALHVSSKVKSWQECAGHAHYKQIYYGVEAQVKKTLKAGISVLLFYGDTDTVCNFLLGSKFAASLRHPLKEQAKPWIFNGQLGGFKTTYEGGLTFITVRGSGHMVPQKKGPEILHVIEAFIQGKEF